LADPSLFIDSSSSKRKAKFFVIFDVPENIPFETSTHQEIEVKIKKNKIKIKK
jgi:hypothetical protein